MDEDKARDQPEAGLFRRVTAEVIDQVRALADALTSTGGATVGALTPSMVGNLLSSLQRLAEQAPAPTAAVDIFVQELRAKRALVVAMRAQLEAFEQELDILERAVQPLNQWGHQWTHVQASLMNSLQVFRPSQTPAAPLDPHGDRT